MNDWQCLGLDGSTDDVAVIKRAYAKRLKVTRPEDDAAAYQALREAYERLLNRGQARAQATDVPTPPAPSAPELRVAAGPTPESLCEALVRTHRQKGRAALQATLPALRLALDALPLEMHDEASVRFADTVIAHPDLPVGVLLALRDHFGWTGDFRVERLMGPGRLQALLERLPVVVVPETDPAALERIALLSGWLRLLESGRLRATLAAWLLDPAMRRQLQFVETLAHHAQHGTLALPGRRLLAALAWDAPAHRSLRESLVASRVLWLAIGTVLLGLLLPAVGPPPGSEFLIAALMGVAGTVAAAATLRVSAWLSRQRARFGTGSAGLPGWAPRMDLYKAHRFGVWLMFLGTFVIWRLLNAQVLSASEALAVLLATGLVGGWLAQPDDAFETLTIFAVVAFATVAMDGMSDATVSAVIGLPFGEIEVHDSRSRAESLRQVGHLVLLCGWFYSGFPGFATGAFADTWRVVRGDGRERRIGALIGLVVTAIPTGAAWAHHRLGSGLMLCAALLAAPLALRLQAAGFTPWVSLLALPAVVAAVWLLRDAANAAGRRLLPMR